MTAEVVVQYEPPADGFHAFPLADAADIPAWLDEHGLEMADASVHFGEDPVVLVAYWRSEPDPPTLRLVRGGRTP
jgi:hypothetical protein